MLKLTDIRKSYKTANFVQTALDGVSITFRSNEFTAVLGPSGSGKTTMLNIIGGLDHYESGDLEIDGISTKEYASRDWDTYRNNRIGFVFQSYNLIPHQSVLANVELALTLSGVSTSERQQRAKKALEDVGLAEHIHKKPNQLSGGQMQRVAIARALINNPEILLADEPTGALDTKTSKQVMELLTEIAKERLVIMVTHNPELAKEYANRIIQLTDGQIVSDSRPFDPSEEKQHENRKIRKASMSFFTAIALSFSNLMTKKTRTLITALAGSIGIIGIAAILSLANGINLYIEDVERETLSLYPLSIQQSGLDITSMIGDPGENTESSSNGSNKEGVSERSMIKNLFSYQNQNDIGSLKQYMEENEKKISPLVNTVQYVYNITPQVYLSDTSKSVEQVNPDSILSSMGMSTENMTSAMGLGNIGSMSSFHELPGEIDMFEHQYDVVAGRWPKEYNEVILVLSSSGKVSDYLLYSMGIHERSELRSMIESSINGKEFDFGEETGANTYSYETLMSPTFKVINPADRYQYDEEYKIWVDRSNDTNYMTTVVNDGVELKIVGIVKPDSDATISTLSAGINYSPELTQYLMDEAKDKQIVKDQIANPTINVLTGRSFIEENEENQSQFNFSDLISIDESKIASAFNLDTSNMNLDFSNLDGLSLDIPADQMPALNLDMAAITSSIASQVNIPTEQLTGVISSVLMDFIIEEITNGVTDPAQISADLTAYLARPDVQESINNQLAGVIDPTLIESQVSIALQNYMQTAMQGYITQMSTLIQSQIESQSTAIMQQVMSQLPEQLKNGLSIDAQAFEEAFQLNMNEDERLNLMNTLMNPTESTYERNLTTLGYADSDVPSQINIYPLNFQSKQDILDMLDTYNEDMEKQGETDKVVRYTDLVGTMMTSVTDIVNTISYALIAFVAISLVVSSIMIGVITYISVIERKKEIGILRALGASKRNIRRVFNAETLIIGFVAGILGISVTALICIPANIFVSNEFGIDGIAQLPIMGAVILVIVSMVLTFIAGLFPSSAAARKDPVEALRSE
ncbi:MAG: ATP-binding cassette domain-containing protein [Coprobacillaceae bacterium]